MSKIIVFVRALHGHALFADFACKLLMSMAHFGIRIFQPSGYEVGTPDVRIIDTQLYSNNYNNYIIIQRNLWKLRQLGGSCTELFCVRRNYLSKLHSLRGYYIYITSEQYHACKHACTYPGLTFYAHRCCGRPISCVTYPDPSISIQPESIVTSVRCNSSIRSSSIQQTFHHIVIQNTIVNRRQDTAKGYNNGQVCWL